jgi:chromosome partitioning protein
MKIISIINNKGGVGKTTLTQNLAVSLARKGNKVGLIDFDPQANLSSVFDYGAGDGTDLVEALLSLNKITNKSFNTTYQENLFILPNQKDITSKLFDRVDIFVQTTILKNKLDNENLDFDYIFIDTPPNLELQTLNAMTASSHILIPVAYERFGVDGIKSVKAYFQKAKETVNPELEILGVVATNVDQRLNMTKEKKEILESMLGKYFLKTEIRTSSKYREAQDVGKDIYTHGSGLNYFSTKKCLEDFDNLTNEIITKLK